MDGCEKIEDAGSAGDPASIYAAFCRCVDLHGNKCALRLADRIVTYRELADRADVIADRLAAAGVGHRDIVGLYLSKREEAIAAMLGVLKLGAAYLPFDTSYPARLLCYIYEDSAPRAMLVDHRTAAAQSPFWTGSAFTLESLERDCELPRLHAGVDAAVHPDDLAYVMYTSGSTGRPKGVMVPHRAVLRLVIGNDYATLDETEVLLQLAPLSFDASTFEIWGALLNGGSLAIMAESHPSLDDIAAAISRHGVSTLWLTAGLFNLMVEHRLDGLRPLRQLLAGGDVLSPVHVERALTALPHCRLINGYGPTENTTFTCCHPVTLPDCRPGPIPIGRPIARTQVHVLDDALRPVVDCGEGELYIGGDGLALGYLNRPDLTAERFIPDPFVRRHDARLYRSGDRVRLRPDGLLEFLGRVDRQVKVNGKRVELDEVESALRRAPQVADAAAVAYSGPDGQTRIAAYLVPSRPGEGGSIQRLLGFLRDELPDYMVPASFTLLDALPLTATGKVDRSKLPQPLGGARGRGPDGELSVDKTAAALVAIWRRVLRRDDIGLDDNFFDLGGSSLQLTSAHALITASVDKELPLLEMFSHPRISLLAAHIANRRQTSRSALSARDRARFQLRALGQAQRYAVGAR
jgi:amino acid adenylation domain-containing protein